MKHSKLVILLIVVILFNNIQAQLKKTSQTNYQYPVYQNYRININEISTIFHHDGRADIDGDAAFYYPKGTDKTCFYESGFLWIGKINEKIVMNGSTFFSGLIPGKIGEDPEQAKMYRVRRDWETAKFETEIAEGEGSFEEIKNKYEYNWYNWPADDGAPFEDIDNNGVYNPDIDVPGFPGADQTIFFITNCADLNKTRSFFEMPPAEVEIHMTIWGYDRSDLNDPLAHMIFKKYEVINKGNADIDTCYFGVWTDPDLGYASDDYLGCDTTLNLAYVYNAYSNDRIYEMNPPAAGFVILQGAKNVIDNTNWGMTSFSYYVNIVDPYGPPDWDYNLTSLYYWNTFTKGMALEDYKFYYLPEFLGGEKTFFPLSGDPVTGEGYIDGFYDTPSDRRFVMPSGPTTLKAGDSQEFIVAQIVGGGNKGISSLEAITQLKKHTQYARLFYNLNFNPVQLELKPSLSVTELDEKLILNWNDKNRLVDEIEKFQLETYSFQGYKVYQLPSLDAPIENGKLIAVLDKIDGIKNITEKIYNKELEIISDTILVYGNDTGRKRYLLVDSDLLNGSKLFNGTEYYFGISAYLYNTNENLTPRMVESEITRVKGIPQNLRPGLDYEVEFSKHLEVHKISGISDATVDVIITEPMKLTGENYEINFVKNDSGAITWNLVNLSNYENLITGNENQFYDNEFFIVDGMLIKVKNNFGIKEAEFQEGNEVITSNGGNKYDFMGFNGSIGVISPYDLTKGKKERESQKELKPVLLKFASVEDDNNYNPQFKYTDLDFSFGYRYVIDPQNKVNELFSNYIQNAVKSYDFESFEQNIPLSAWDMSDPDKPRRLAVGFIETNNFDGKIDGKYWPNEFTPDKDKKYQGAGEFLLIFDEDYSEEDNVRLKKNIKMNDLPVIYWCTFLRENKKAWRGDEEFLIEPFNLNTENDVYRFTTPKVGYDKDQAKEDVNKINIFPNPYYGYNPQESSFHESFVTFNHLPDRATIRIYNLAGQHIRTIHKNDASQFLRWNLLNKNNYRVGSGIYVIHIDMPDIGTSKILKLAVIQRKL